jgi:cytochrome P450
MDQDFGAQDSDHPSRFYLNYRELLETYANERMDLPWYFTPRTEWKRRNLSQSLRNELRSIIESEFINMQNTTIKTRSILSLSLQNINKLTPQILNQTCDQLSTFLFAGHDTTSALLSWMFYELSRTPRALKAVRDELETIFGPGAHASQLSVLINLCELCNYLLYVNVYQILILAVFVTCCSRRVAQTY